MQGQSFIFGTSTVGNCFSVKRISCWWQRHCSFNAISPPLLAPFVFSAADKVIFWSDGANVTRRWSFCSDLGAIMLWPPASDDTVDRRDRKMLQLPHLHPIVFVSSWYTLTGESFLCFFFFTFRSTRTEMVIFDSCKITQCATWKNILALNIMTQRTLNAHVVISTDGIL